MDFCFLLLQCCRFPGLKFVYPISAFFSLLFVSYYLYSLFILLFFLFILLMKLLGIMTQLTINDW